MNNYYHEIFHYNLIKIITFYSIWESDKNEIKSFLRIHILVKLNHFELLMCGKMRNV